MSVMMDEVREAKLGAIRRRLSDEDMLIHLAEEASELVQASTKTLRRIRGSNHPNVEELRQLENNLVEEATDVAICLELLGVEASTDMADHKIDGWIGRLESEDVERRE